MLVVVDILIAAIFNTMHNVMKRGFYKEFIQTLKQVLMVLAITSLYLFAMQRVLFGHLTTRIDTEKCHDVDKIEGIAMGAVALLVVLYGIWPDLALDMIGYFAYPAWM